MNKNLLIFLVTLLFALGGYFFFSKKNSSLTETQMPTIEETKKETQSLKRDFENSSELISQPEEEEQEEDAIEKQPEQLDSKQTNTIKSPQEKLEAEAEKMIEKLLDDTYAEFYEELNLPEEKREEMSRFLLKNQKNIQKFMMDLLNPNLTDEQIGEEQEAIRANQEAEFDQILDPSQQAVFDRYQKELPVKTTTKVIPNLYTLEDGSSLPPQYYKGVAEALIRNSKKQNPNSPLMNQAHSLTPGRRDNIALLRADIKNQVGNPAEQMKKKKLFDSEVAAEIEKIYGIKIKAKSFNNL